MEFKYEYGVIGYCQDLADPSPHYDPIAFVATGYFPVEKIGVTAMGYRTKFIKNLKLKNEIAQSVLSKYDEYLYSLVEEWVRNGANGSLIEWLSSKMGGSVAVIKVESVTEEIQTPVKISTTLSEICSAELADDPFSIPAMYVDPIPFSFPTHQHYADHHI